MAGESEGSELSERQLVESLLRDLEEAAQRWEDRLAAAESTAFGVDLGDIHAVANSDGRLVELRLDSGVAAYSHGELADRLNLAFGALRREAYADFQRRHGGGSCH
jgi:hypothetical protein